VKTNQTKTSSSSNSTQQAEKHSFFGKSDNAVAEPAHFFGPRKEGNSFFNASSIQPKLTVGKPNDPYEREADAVADQVVQKMGEKTAVQEKESTPSISTLIQPKCNDCEQEEGFRKKESVPGPAEKLSLKALPETGKPLQSKAEKNVQPKAEVVQPKAASPAAAPAIQAQCSDCGEEEKLQKKEEGPEGSEKLLRKAIFESNEDAPVQRKAQPGIVMKKVEVGPEVEEEKVQKKAEEAPPEKLQPKPLPEITPVKLQAKAEPAAALPVKTVTPTPAPAAVQAKCESCEEESGKEEESEGELQTKIFKKPIFDSNNNSEGSNLRTSAVNRRPSTVDSLIQRRCRECEEGSIVLRKAEHIIQRVAVSGQSGTGTPEAIVEAAKGELGKVQARNDDGSGKRVGSDRLLEYFHTAAPDVWPDSIIETAGAEMPSWCGIFSVWAHKKAGKDVGNWQMGKGVSANNSLTVTDSPQPGDIGYIDQPYQHHCIIERVEGDTIHSIDGNSGLFSEVIRNIRPRSIYTGFFTAFGGGGGTVQRKEEQEAEPVQMKTEDNPAPSNVEQQLSSSKGGGQPLPESTRSGMEQSMGADFSGVRIHTDSSAVQMNKDLHAQAFTHGSDIYFNSGKFDAGSTGGQHLLAHELTHVVQQGSAPAVQQKPEEEEKAPAVTEVPKEEEVINTLPEQSSSGPEIQKQPATATPDGDASSAAEAVYDALDGWTSSGDSATILSKFTNRNKPTCDFILSEVARKASKAVKDVFQWMLDDMVDSDWKALRSHLIATRVQGVEVIIAYEVADKLDGYTSDDDSREIVSLFMGSAPVRGTQLTTVLAQLELKANLGPNDMAELLFGEMGSIDADKLCKHFFESGSVEARRYGAHWRAGKVRDLLSGWTGSSDSEKIVMNFERTPASGRLDVLAALEIMCQQEWGQTAPEALMEDMWQVDYEKLREHVPTLPVWNVERSWLEWGWEGLLDTFDFLGAMLQYGVCGIVGVIWGALLIVKDVVVVVWDLLLAAYNLLGWILHQISGGNLAREEADKVRNFFIGIGKFFDAPGEAISMMWDDLVLESTLIEGPFTQCRQAIFWVSRITNFVVNVLLILAGGYGAVKLALQGLEALVNIVRAGELMAALSRLRKSLPKAIKNLPSAAAKGVVAGTDRVLKLIKAPAETLNGVWGKVGQIRRVAAEEGYYKFLRQQAGKAIKEEGDFWRERKDFWTRKAEAADIKATEAENKLAQAVENSVDDPVAAEATVAKAEQEAQAANKEVDDVLNEITGDSPAADPAKPPATAPAPTDFNSRLPEAWRGASPPRPGMLDLSVSRMKKMGVSEDTLISIARNVANTKDDGYMFFADLNRFAKAAEEGKFSRPVFDAIVNGMASEKNFRTGRMLMEKISNNAKGNIDALIRTFSMEDIGSLRTRFPAKKNSDFLNDLDSIGARINAKPEEVMSLINEAGESEKAMDDLLEALDRLGEGQHTPEQVRESLAFGKKVAEALAKGGEELAKTIWGQAYKGKDPNTGKYLVNEALTKNSAGDKAPSFIMSRSDLIAEQLLGGGTEISAENWAKVYDVLSNTDLPVHRRNQIVGHAWAAAKKKSYSMKGYDVIDEVNVAILNPDGTPTGKSSYLDAVLRSKDGKEIKYKEFKSSDTATTSEHQELVYPMLENGQLNLLKPYGPKAEAAFGGPGMPDFRPGKVDIERPPKL
jgi:hypothetical protein